MSRSSRTLLGAAAAGSCFVAHNVFVPSVTGPAAATQSPALRGGAVDIATRASSGDAGSASVMSVLGVAGALTALASARGQGKGSRTACRAEPVSAAAAAAAAAKSAGAASAAAKSASAAKAAAAAAGAAKATGAVAGSAGAGTLAQATAAEDEMGGFGDLTEKKFFPQDRGTPEYEAWMKQMRAKKARAWEQRTARSYDGNEIDKSRKSDNLYDPLVATQPGWLDGAKEGGLYSGEFDPAYQVGVTEPFGYFDPLGFCKKGDVENFNKLRAAELKHGRVAMMGALGAVVQHYVQFPGFKDVPTGLAAVNSPPGSYGAIALFLVSGALELGVWTESPEKEPGNFGDPLGFDQYTEEFRNRELNNGRFAMFAVIGIMAAEILTGKDAVEQFGF